MHLLLFVNIFSGRYDPTRHERDLLVVPNCHEGQNVTVTVRYLSHSHARMGGGMAFFLGGVKSV